MWNAVIDSKATARGFQDLYGLPLRGKAENRDNLVQVGVPLLNAASTSASLTYAPDRSAVVPVRMGTLDATTFLDLFGKLAWHEEYDVRIDPLKRFMQKATDDGRIKEWVVVWPQPTKEFQEVTIDGLGIDPARIITRKRRSDRIDFIGSDAKHRMAALPIARGDSVPGLPGTEGRGVVLASLVDDRAADDGDQETGDLAQGSVVALLSLAVPASATPHKRDLIQWTVRVQSKEADAAIDKDGLASIAP
jgi:hypothetical protein